MESVKGGLCRGRVEARSGSWSLEISCFYGAFAKKWQNSTKKELSIPKIRAAKDLRKSAMNRLERHICGTRQDMLIQVVDLDLEMCPDESHKFRS